MELADYVAPEGAGESEIIEKRSKFIGYVVPVADEDAAKEEIARVKARYHDARHNCWCYIIRGGAERYSDDGEPQGTAGLPMLEVFRRGGIHNVCCVVTRYFGGILLGPGGLSRAYTEAARLALDDAGTVLYRLFECMEIVCSYNLMGRVKSELESFGGVIDDIEYGEAVIIRSLFHEGRAEAFNTRLADISAGAVIGRVTGKRYGAANVKT